MREQQGQEYYADEQVPLKSDEIYAQVMHEERIRNTLSHTSPDNQLIEIEFRIRGYKKDYITNQWIPIDKKSVHINENLVSKYMAYLSSILNDGTRYGNYSSMEINRLMKLIIEWVTDDLNTNAEDYGIQGNYTEMTRVGHIVFNYTFSVLKRAQNGMESGRIWKSLTIGEQSNQGFPTEKKGLIDSLKFWKK